MITEKGKYYLYRHIRSDKNQPFYIGIGTKTKDDVKYEIYTRSTVDRKYNPIWHNIKNKTSYTIEILLESNDYEFIKQKEVEFIKLYGRIDLKTGILSNMTDGGEGTKNVIVSENARKLRSVFQTGKKKSENSIKKRINTLKERGFRQSEKTINKIKESKAISVCQYSLQGKLIKCWNSIQEAALHNGLKSYIITNSANTRNLKSYTGGNFIWLYENDIESKNLHKFNKALERVTLGKIKKSITKEEKEKVFNDFKRLDKKIKKGVRIKEIGKLYNMNYSTVRSIVYKLK